MKIVVYWTTLIICPFTISTDFQQPPTCRFYSCSLFSGIFQPGAALEILLETLFPSFYFNTGYIWYLCDRKLYCFVQFVLLFLWFVPMFLLFHSLSILVFILSIVLRLDKCCRERSGEQNAAVHFRSFILLRFRFECLQMMEVMRQFASQWGTKTD